MRSYSDSHTPSHAHSQAHTTHPPTLPHMRYASWTSRPRPPGGEGGALLGAFLLEEMNLAPWQSPAIRFQWVHSHTCLIAWPIQGGARRGCRPLESEGPENCNRFWFTSVHNYVWVLRFVVLHYCKISWFVNFGCPRWSLADIFVFLCNFELFSEGDSSNNRSYVGMSLNCSM